VANGGDGSSYDVLLYPPRPFVQTHPDRLATLATLFGLEPPPPATARVLELGCGEGGNLLPMAALMPGATFVGIDNAAVPIARANAIVERLGLTNIAFHEVGIEEYDPPADGFDYVIAHGVFSWVPDHVREALLALAGRVLTEHGVAYVSYNALPGGQLRQMLRGALATHLGPGTPAERVAEARRFLRWLIAVDEGGDDLAPTLARAAREVVDNDDAFLFHDVLADDNRPFALREFLDRAHEHGLRYLAEAQFSEMQPGVLPPDLRTTAEQIEDPIRREEYLDLLKERRFRQTLLCRAERAPSEPDAERLTGMAASGALRWTVDDATKKVTFLGPGTAHVVTDHPLLVRTLGTIGHAWPDPVPLAALGDEARGPAIRDLLLRAHAADLVRLHVHPPHVSTTPPERPRISAHARLQAAEGTAITTVRHTSAQLEDTETRQVATLLDGSRDRASLDAQALDRIAAAGLLLPEELPSRR
jgi:SAM-dependent methyltransferase